MDGRRTRGLGNRVLLHDSQLWRGVDHMAELIGGLGETVDQEDVAFLLDGLSG